MEDLHNIIHTMALDYANEAWDFIQTTNMRVPSPGTLQLSQNEYLRFCRAFYRVEIFHSVERPGPNWLAQGLRFLVKITSDLSYDEKKNLLYSKYGPGDLIHLWKSLDMSRTWLDTDRQPADDPWVHNEDGSLVHLDKDAVDAMDLDLGPREAFARSIAGPTPIEDLGYYGSRDRAYVLWDMDRLLQLEAGWAWTVPTRSSDRFYIFVDEPKPIRVPAKYQGVGAEKNLEKSIQARMEIWDKGGSGYWRADDLSKIMWAGERWVPHAYPEY
ncbi:hypothetical protein CBS470a_004190 [Colletotrichum nupharicola]|nr:hypothetical protein CBS470a_004190 [Colletotrichum nupharicola]